MSAAAVSTSQAATKLSRSPIVFLPLILGALMLIAYHLLPFVQQPELGATTLGILTASRANNEFGIVTNGLRLMWFSGLSVLLVGLWNAFNPQTDRAFSILTALGGVLALTYFVIFYRDYAANEGAYISQMGIAFWGMLAVSMAMLLQVFVPRSKPLPQFQIGRVFGNQESILLFATALMLVIIGVMNPRFVAERNLLDILQGNAYIAVAAIGMSMVIITGNIDISVGSLVALLAVISGKLVVGGAPVWIAWIAPVLIGVAVGAGIGALVAYLRVPSIVVTLAMLSIIKGGIILWTSGQRVTDMPAAYYLAQWRPLGVPMPVWFMIVLTVVALLWMRYSGVGRSFYAVGGNKEAARLSGLNEQVVVLQAFMMNGLFAGIASLLYATQFQVIQPTPPPFLELNIITASVVGGVSILGGTGTVIGSTLAAVLLNMIRSGMVFINVDPFWLKSVQGLLILVTVLADLLRRRNQRGA